MKNILILIFSCIIYSNATCQETEFTNPIEKIYTIVDKDAEFKGGMSAFGTFLRQELRFPIEMKENNATGTVYIQFVIDTLGKVNDIKVLKGMGYGCDEEAIRFIEKTNKKWTPAVLNGQKVKVQKMYPIKFTLKELVGNYLINKAYVDEYVSALKLMRSADYTEAIVMFTEIIIKTPKCRGALFNRGICYSKTSKLTEACNDWSQGKNIGDKSLELENVITENCK